MKAIRITFYSYLFLALAQLMFGFTRASIIVMIIALVGCITNFVQLIKADKKVLNAGEAILYSITDILFMISLVFGIIGGAIFFDVIH